MNPVVAFEYGGGWIERSAVTGATFGLIRRVGWMVAADAILTSGIGTGEVWSIEHLQRNVQQALHARASTAAAGAEHARTPQEDLARIREVLKPAVSDLAATVGVSRQSVYNWTNGDPVSDENAAKLQDLARAADVLVREGIVVNAALLKRKIAHGKTLFQVVQTGGSAQEAVLQFVQIQQREAAQRARMRARFSNRATTSATADFDLPAPNDVM